MLRRMTTLVMINWVCHQSNSNAWQTSKYPKLYLREIVSFMVVKVRMGGGCYVLLPDEDIMEVVLI